MIRQVLLSLVLLASTFPALAEGGSESWAERVEAYRSAGASFDALITGAATTSDKERLRAKDASALVAILSDEKRFLGGQARGKSDLEGLMAVCGIANKAVMSLAFFDVKNQVNPKGSPEEVMVGMRGVMERNAHEFEPHFGQLQPFMLRCMGQQTPLLAEFVQSLKPEEFTEVRRTGLQQVRRGLIELYAGALLNSGDSRFGREYRFAVTEALADSAPALLSALPLDIRAQLLPLVDQALEASPEDFKPLLKRVRAALADSTCGVLCRL